MRALIRFLLVFLSIVFLACCFGCQKELVIFEKGIEKNPNMFILRPEDHIYGDTVTAKVCLLLYGNAEAVGAKNAYDTLQNVVNNSPGNVLLIYRYLIDELTSPRARHEVLALEFMTFHLGEAQYFRLLDTLIGIRQPTNARLRAIAWRVGVKDTTNFLQEIFEPQFKVRIAQNEAEVLAINHGLPGVTFIFDRKGKHTPVWFYGKTTKEITELLKSFY